MKNLRTLLRSLFALVLALASTPAWACARSCNPAAEANLACVKLCAHSQALLTEGGKLASLGAQACGVQTLQAPTFLSVDTFELAQPALGAFVVLPTADGLMAADAAFLLPGRAPPRAPDFLASYHPQANAPPYFG